MSSADDEPTIDFVNRLCPQLVDHSLTQGERCFLCEDWATITQQAAEISQLKTMVRDLCGDCNGKSIVDGRCMHCGRRICAEAQELLEALSK